MRKSKGFTLIELLVVIAIIGILAAIVLVSLSGARNKAKDARIIADMNQIRSAAEIYYSDTNTYVGLTDETNVKSLLTDIGDQGGAYSYATTGTDNYCVVAKLNSGQFWCVDGKLTSKQYTASPDTCIAATSTCNE